MPNDVTSTTAAAESGTPTAPHAAQTTTNSAVIWSMTSASTLSRNRGQRISSCQPA
jgi:hypothetical protein